MKKLIVANWKMNPSSLLQAGEIIEAIDGWLSQYSDEKFFLIVCPPFVFLEEVAKMISLSSCAGRILLGAQDISQDDTGALTGEISGPMLVKLGVRYVIAGHSERRWKLGETDEQVNKKIKAILRNELTPVVCVGERFRDVYYQEFLRTQVQETFKDIQDDISRCVVAYEPVWAISTTPGAQADNPQNAVGSIEKIRERLAQPPIAILYGGSVNSQNVKSFIAHAGIDGVMVGGASVQKDEFISLLNEVHAAL